MRTRRGGSTACAEEWDRRRCSNPPRFNYGGPQPSPIERPARPLERRRRAAPARPSSRPFDDLAGSISSTQARVYEAVPASASIGGPGEPRPPTGKRETPAGADIVLDGTADRSGGAVRESTTIPAGRPAGQEHTARRPQVFGCGGSGRRPSHGATGRGAATAASSPTRWGPRARPPRRRGPRGSSSWRVCEVRPSALTSLPAHPPRPRAPEARAGAPAVEAARAGARCGTIGGVLHHRSAR